MLETLSERLIPIWCISIGLILDLFAEFFCTDRLGTFGSRSRATLFVQDVSRFLPESIFGYLIDHAPNEKLQHARDTALLATQVAKELVDSKTKELLDGTGNRDVMSLLGSFQFPDQEVLYQPELWPCIVKANASEKDNTKMNEEEVLSQMRYLFS